MFIIKLGGSMITYKDDISSRPLGWNESDIRYRIREDRISIAADVLHNYLDKGLVLVHGGGTHGHRTVRRWKEGWTNGNEEMMVWEVKWRMLQLTERLIAIMGKHKVPLVEVSPSDITLMKDNKIVSLDDSIIRGLMEKGCVPVLRGDLAMNEDHGWSIISGDEIIKTLSRSMKDKNIEKVIMCMDMEGVYRNFGMNDQTIIKSMDRPFEQLQDMDYSDETGGIQGKISTCLDIAKNGVNAQIIGGDIGISLEKALNGIDTGTLFPCVKRGS